MKIAIVLSALVAASAAYVCLPNACDGIEQPLLNCRGPIIKGSGWCGCTDSCAKLEGEECSVSLFSVPNNNQCHEGLTCKPVNLGGIGGKHVCVNASKADEFVSKRFIVCPPNACDGVQQEELNCAGTVYSSGFCGCKKTCAKQKGESCHISILGPLLGVPATEEKCEDGLECKDLNLEGHYTPVCVDLSENKDEVLMSKRQAGLMTCPENACDNVEQVQCKGGRLEKAGPCGCTDVCKKLRGEHCIPDSYNLQDVVNTQVCDEGLVCHIVFEAKPICLMPNETSTFVSKRSTSRCDTACRKKSQQCTFSFVIYPGQWFAKCDLEGNFIPQQCDNQGQCFCVDQTGTIDESTRVLGSANCS